MRGIESVCCHCGTVGYAYGLFWSTECANKAACRDRVRWNQEQAAKKAERLEKENKELREQLYRENV